MSPTASSDNFNPGRPAVILLSGGLDSATVLGLARREGHVCHALTIAYGQRHEVELQAARAVFASLPTPGGRHVEMALDLRVFGGSALTDHEIEVPKHADHEPGRGSNSARGEAAGSAAGEIPVTYVPARNTIFLSLALAYAETVGSRDIYIGANAVDYSGYPDCRPAFVEAFEALANVATKACVEAAAGDASARIRIHAPLMHMSKAEIIRAGAAAGVDFRLTRSCYDPDPATGRACGRCDACVLRRQGFLDAGLADPTPYAEAAIAPRADGIGRAGARG